MTLSLQVVSSDAEFDDLIDCEWTAYETPHNSAWKFLYPVWGSAPEDRAAAMQESKQRQLESHHTKPNSNWLKVVDNDTGAVVGGALWYVYEKNPYQDFSMKDVTCTWWPEGPKRQMADDMMVQFITPRVERMAKPHLLLDLCFVHPSHRRRGVGRLLMDWGNRKADEMGVEAFVESTHIGRPFYESCEFITMNEFELNPTPPQNTEELRKLQRDLRCIGYFMWRPIGGKFEKGTTKIPWEEIHA